MKVSIPKAIKTKQQYVCKINCDDWEDDNWELDSSYTEQEKIFEITITDFEKIDFHSNKSLSGTFDFEDFEPLIINADLWSLKVQVINLNKKEMSSFPIIETLFLEDSNRNQFRKCDHDFVKNTSFANKFAMNVFSGCFPADVPFLPNIPVNGAIPFLLPKDINENCFLSINGTIYNRNEYEEVGLVENDNGWIYVLMNSSFESDLLKIGVTQRTPEKRANELSKQTGIPNPFQVAFSIEVGECIKVEKLIHSTLEKFRYTSNREFFKISINNAKSIITQIAENFPLKEISSIEEQKRESKRKEIQDQIDELETKLREL